MTHDHPTDEDYQHIREKLIDYLSRQGFSEKKLLQKVTDLKRRYPRTARYRFYTPEHVQKVIDELKSAGYIDDRTYAESVLRQLLDRKDGIYRIRQKMVQRLIPQDIINEVIKEWEESDGRQDYAAIIRAAKAKYQQLLQKHPGKKEQYTVRQKLYAFLAQKGYTPDEIGEIIKRAAEY